MRKPPKGTQARRHPAAADEEQSRLREINDALLTSAVRQHELTEQAEHAEKGLRETQQQLTVELSAMQLLHEISTQLIQEDNVEALYEKILDAAVAIMGADFASIQILHPERGAGAGELRLMSFRGFSPDAAKFWEWVRADSKSTCGRALRTGERCLVPDVDTCDFMAGTEDLRTYLHAGIRAVQTTPLVSRSGHVLGMLSTHWGQPHQPSEQALRLLDILARQAADLIERSQADAHRKLLVDELSHRVKNTLATVQSIALQTFGGAHESAERLWQFESRLMALANTHALLSKGQWRSVNLHELLARELAPFSDQRSGRVEVSGHDMPLRAPTALALGMAFHELATNAVKYGALSDAQGKIRIASQPWNGGEPGLRLTWTESGGPEVKQPKRHGFGMRLIRGGLAHELNGEVQVDYPPDGLVCTMDVPLNLEQAHDERR